jgi:hypothetical protein
MPSGSSRTTISRIVGSSERTLRKRSRKPRSSAMATDAPQWAVRYCTCSGDEEL